MGKVYLVGAGPGDPKLITLKGLECLKRADVVIYDRLTSKALLSFTPPGAELIYVGKAGGQYRPFSQEYINELTLSKAREGKMVVRLKGGDPFVFGRGGEEAEFLKEKGISIEVVPGVSSAQAVPAYAGIPLTHRRYASTVALVTGHEDPAKFKREINWEKLATATKTIVIFMALKNLSLIAEELVRHGRSKDTPVALIRWGTLPDQETIVGTLENIVERAEKADFNPPALIVVGEVVKLREKLKWFEEKPLFGKRVLVTRSKSQAGELTQALEDLGATVIEFPTIKIEPPASYERLDEAIHKISQESRLRQGFGGQAGVPPTPRLRRASRSQEKKLPATHYRLPTGYDWIIFTSANGVDFFFERLKTLGKDARVLNGIKLAAIGPATARELEALSLSADYVPSEYRAEAVIDGFKKMELEQVRILIPRAEVAREILPQKLKELGADVEVVPVYRTTLADSPGKEIKKTLEEKRVNVVTFTSSSTVKNFVKLLQDIDLNRALNGALVACIGPITADTAKDLGIKVDLVAKEYTVAGLVTSIVKKVHPKATAL